MSKRVIPGALAAVVLALCLVATADATRSPRETTYRPNARDLAIARSLLLVRADVPAKFKLERSSGKNADDPGCSSYDPDLSRLVSTAEVEGRNFRHVGKTGMRFLASMATLFRTTGEANVYWRQGITHRKVGPCLVEIISESFGNELALANVKVIPARFAKGDLAVHSWNLVGDLRAGTRVLGKTVIEIAVLKRGRAISSLMTITLGEPLGAESRSIAATFGRKLGDAAVSGGPAA